nr:hypothetical protein [Tanacetum cinerariifolium]
MWILGTNLIFAFSRKFWPSFKVPSYFDCRDMTLSQLIDFSIHDFYSFFHKMKKLNFVCHWANPFKDLKWSNVPGVKFSSLFESDDTFSRAEVEEDDRPQACFLGGKISSGQKKSQELSDGDNIRDGGKIVDGAIRACGRIGEKASEAKRSLVKSFEESGEVFLSEAGKVILEDYMRKASLKCPGDGKFVALHEKYVNLFKDPISFEDDGNGDNVGDDDDENGDDDDGNVDNDANDCDGNRDKEDVNEGDKDPNGSNPSFGFSKIILEDFGNDSGPAEKDKVVEGNPAEQGTVVEGNQAEECEIMSTPENFTQWLEKNVDLVREVIDSITAEYLYGDLFGDTSATLEAMNQEITPEKLPTQKASPSPKKRAVKPSSYLLSPYMNKKTNVVPKITRLEFILGNSLLAMQGDKMVIESKSHEIHSESRVIYSESDVIYSESHSENVFEAHFGKFIVYGVRLNLETLAPGLWLDANVIDCWGTILNHEESFRATESKSKHFFPTGCISKSMFDGTLASFDAKWESFSNQVNAQFKVNKGGLGLGGIDLKKLFARHLKQYGHIRHTQVAKVKHTIPKLKWETKENFHDCEIFTMLHMETFDGGPASNLDCGLPMESQLLRDMLRRLRFKFATKILLHEINVHAGKMLELAKEFDKTDPVEKIAMIVDAFKKREEHDCI